MFLTTAFALALAQVSATPIQEAHIQATLGVAVQKMGRATCDLPKPNESDLLVVVGGYEGRSFTNVTVAGQDKTTLLTDIVIEKGRYPVYLLLSSYSPTLWRLSGDVERLRQVAVVQSEGAGVVGVPRSAVHFTTSDRCNLPYRVYPSRTYEHEVPVLAIFGRRANAIGGDYGLYRVTVTDSSLEVDRRYSRYVTDKVITEDDRDPVLPHRNADGTSELEALLHNNFPPGIAEVELTEVIATGPVERYEILPMVAGSVQLERRGALIPATVGDIRRWKNRALIGGHVRADEMDDLYFYSAYRVTKPIHLPAELCGGYSLTLFVPSRSYVSGSPCHSNIYVDDGTIMAGPGASAGE